MFPLLVTVEIHHTKHVVCICNKEEIEQELNLHVEKKSTKKEEEEEEEGQVYTWRLGEKTWV
jgi:hypothetical protein